MKRLIPLLKRVGPLLRLASEYTAAHMAARMLAAASGLLLVRLLPVDEYGFYTLVLAAFTFICTFSDLGATETLSFFRWRAGKKNRSWMPYFHAVVRFRRTVFVFGFFSSAAYIFYMGRHIGEDTRTILAGIALMGLSAWFAIQSGIISYALKLEQRFREAYAVELSNESIKILAVGLIWLMGAASATAGMATVAVGAFIAAILATRLLDHHFKETETPRQESPSKIDRIVHAQVVPVIPGAVYFSVQGPLVAGLAAYFGSVANVAEVGALGRLGVLVGVVSGFTGSVFLPRLLTISDDNLFLKRYLHWWIVIILFGVSLLLMVALFPATLLGLLGDAYFGLHRELLTVSATAIVGTWGAYAWGVNRAQGWVRYQPWSVPTMLAGQTSMLLHLDLSSTGGVLLFGLGTGLLGLVFQLVVNIHGFTSTKSNQKAPVNCAVTSHIKQAKH